MAKKPYIGIPRQTPQYVKLEYIETTGTQYVNTGVEFSAHQDGLQFIFDGEFTGFTSDANGYLFGHYHSNGGRLAFSFKKSQDGNVNEAFTFWVGNKRAIGFANIPAIGQRFTVVATGDYDNAENATATLDGVEGTKLSFYNVSGLSGELLLFMCDNVTADKYCGKLYKFAINNADGTPIRNFVPCRRISDNVIGLYDMVNGVFYENEGTGEFIGGAEIVDIGVARKVKKLYIGVNNAARKIKKAYIGVNGVARLIWSDA